MIRRELQKRLAFGPIVLIALSTSLLVACTGSPVPSYKVITTHDESGLYTADSMAGNSLEGKLSHELNAARYLARDGTVNYALGVYYFGKDWMFIKPGESLILVIDGKRHGLKGQGSLRYRKTLENGTVSELAKYPVTPQLLKEIANANRVDVTIIGGNFVSVAHFSERNFENFKKFVNDYVK
jgi:hypothetical protein